MRKNNEAPKERKAIPTAREMSRIKYERQLKMEEQNRLLRMQYATNAQNVCLLLYDYDMVKLIHILGKEGCAAAK